MGASDQDRETFAGGVGGGGDLPRIGRLSQAAVGEGETFPGSGDFPRMRIGRETCSEER